MSNKRAIVTTGPEFDADMPEPEDMIILMGDLECGEGSIDYTDTFKNETNLMKADLLQDWIQELQAQYEAVLEQGIVGPQETTH